MEVEGRQSPGCPERGESGLRLRQRPSLQLPTRKGLLPLASAHMSNERGRRGGTSGWLRSRLGGD